MNKNNNNVFMEKNQQYSISCWKNKYDNQIDGSNWTWEKIVEFVETPTITSDKEKVGLWNLNTFEPMERLLDNGFTQERSIVYRRNRNCTFITGLIIDVDNDNVEHQLTIEDAQELYSKWTHLIFPSYRHLHDGKTNKFRIVLPFNKPMPYFPSTLTTQWDDTSGSEKDGENDQDNETIFRKRLSSLKKVTGWSKPANGFKHPIDEASYKPAQGFFKPSTPFKNKWFVIRNDAELFDWEKETTEEVVAPRQAKPIRDAKAYNGETDIIELIQNIGPVSYDDWKSILGAMYNLGFDYSDAELVTRSLRSHHAHNDVKNAWNFATRISTAGIGTIHHFVLQTQGPEAANALLPKPALDLTKTKVEETVPGGIEDAFEMPVAPYAEAYNRDKRSKLTENAYKKWKKDGYLKTLLLYAFEGFGKSRMVHTLINDSQKVVFASKSNEQAEEQAKTFEEQGLKVLLVLSREYQLKKLGYSDYIVKKAKTNPWDSSTVDKDATIRQLRQIMTKEEANELWVRTSVPSIDWSDVDVVVMTHARLALTGMIQETKRLGQQSKGVQFDWIENLPKHIVCFWDDVDRKDFAWLTPYDVNYAGVELPNGQLIETKAFKKVARNKQVYDALYFIKPDCYRYGYGLQNNRQIYSTTEILTTILIERYVGEDKLFTPELMPVQKMMAGDISLLKTTMTGRNKDGLLLPLLNRVKKEGYDFYLIGDSLSPINHTNNKGQNCFTDKDIVVELSQMNMLDIPMWLDELEWSEEDIHKMKVLDALDRLHQAVGRNSGYRWADTHDEDKKSVVALIDGELYKDVLAHSRYYISYSDDLDKPNYATYRKRTRDTLVDCISWYIQNLDAYITAPVGRGKNKFNPFQKDCFEVAVNSELKFVERMKFALEKYISSSKNKNANTAVSAVLSELG